MATQTFTSLIDDLDGTSEADESVDFALDGRRYEIDLTKDNAGRLRDALAEFIAAARKATGRPDRPARPEPGQGRKRSDRDENTAIRQWVRDNNGKIADRGRIPATIVTAYRKGDVSALSSGRHASTEQSAGVESPQFAEAPSF